MHLNQSRLVNLPASNHRALKQQVDYGTICTFTYRPYHWRNAGPSKNTGQLASNRKKKMTARSYYDEVDHHCINFIG
jgi:hypothetical protein